MRLGFAESFALLFVRFLLHMWRVVVHFAAAFLRLGHMLVQPLSPRSWSWAPQMMRSMAVKVVFLVAVALAALLVCALGDAAALLAAGGVLVASRSPSVVLPASFPHCACS